MRGALLVLLALSLGCGGSLSKPAVGDAGADARPDALADGSRAVDGRGDGAEVSLAPPDGASDLQRDVTGDASGADASGDATCAPISCAPFVCRQGQCLSSCDGDEDCQTPARCQSGTCRGIPLLSCTQHAECASGHCYQGVCCDRPCDGVCASCAQPASRGVCTPLPLDALPAAGVCDGDGGADATVDSAAETGPADAPSGD